MQIKSKGKGKSGGARVISFLETILVGKINQNENETIVNLISIYDKSDVATISDKELNKLVEAFYKDK